MQLLYFSFLEHDMLAHNRVVLLELELVGCVLAVLGRGVVVAGVRSGDQLDLFGVSFSAGHGLYLLTASADFGDNGFDAFLVNDAHAVAGNAQRHKTLFRFQPETMLMEIGFKTATTPVIGVRNSVAHQRLFAGDLTDFGHDEPLKHDDQPDGWRIKGALYTSFDLPEASARGLLHCVPKDAE
jgi:hypothetical protein